jgi:hypothetical protein
LWDAWDQSPEDLQKLLRDPKTSEELARRGGSMQEIAYLLTGDYLDGETLAGRVAEDPHLLDQLGVLGGVAVALYESAVLQNKKIETPNSVFVTLALFAPDNILNRVTDSEQIEMINRLISVVQPHRELRVAFDPAFIQKPDRILVQPGVEVPQQWQEIPRQILPENIEDAQKLLEQIGANTGDFALLNYSIVRAGSVDPWDELLRSREIAGLALSDDLLNSVNRLMPSELAALLAVVRMAGGLTVPVGVEVYIRANEEKQLLLAA